ncbi:MAG: replicative DNA helicase [Actinomycetota bacterium]
MARRLEEIPGGRTQRIPPHNLEAEESVLGSMMLSSEAIAQVIEIVRSDDYYRQAHREIHKGLIDLYARGEPVDAITAVEELKRNGTLEGAGGQLYIHHLVETVPTPASAAHYARIVADHSLLRRLIEASSTIIQRAYDVPEQPDGLADEAEQLIYNVARHSEKEEIVQLRELISESMEDLERLHDRESEFVGVPTGFQDLDELLQGLHPGNFVIVAARPGVGKSSFVTNIARNVAVAGTPVAMFSLEMSRREIAMRLLCGEARVPWEKIRAARVAPEDWGRIVEAAEVLDRTPLFIVDAGNVNIVDIRAKARRLASRPDGIGLIIVDYMQLMSSPHRVENRQQEIAEISRGLKLLAKELAIPVMGVSQLNRDPERRVDKKPQLADLRECVTGETLVALGDGRRLPIRELVGVTPEVVSVSAEGRLVLARSDKVWRVGKRPVFRIRLASGREIRATARHRLLGAEGWTRIENLQIGDRLAIARRLPEPVLPRLWSDPRVALLGQLIGEASSPRRYRGHGIWRQLCLSGNGNRWHAAGVNRWLRELGISGRRPPENRVPEAAFQLSNRQVAILLRHLWATDGSIQFRSNAKLGSSNICFGAGSRELANDVAILLLRLGLVSRISREPRAGRAQGYLVSLSDTQQQRSFLDTVGAFGPRVPQARRLEHRLQQNGSKRQTEFAPSLTRTLVVDRRRLPDDDPLRSQPSTDLFWDRVVGIESDGEEDVYDLTVPGPESWLADSIVSHNSGSLEQDADVVMLIHREDVYTDEPSVKGLAEINVAKHRNGPTDKIKLTFLSHLTQFRNFARAEQPARPD